MGKAPSSGEARCCHNKPGLNGNPAYCRILGWQVESWAVNCRHGQSTVVSGAAATFTRRGFEPPTKKSPLPALPFGH